MFSEYLIRGDDGEPDLDLSQESYAAAFSVLGWNGEEESGRYVLRRGDAEVEFLDEIGFGWHMATNDIDRAEADEIASAVASALARVTGRPVKVVSLR